MSLKPRDFNKELKAAIHEEIRNIDALLSKMSEQKELLNRKLIHLNMLDAMAKIEEKKLSTAGNGDNTTNRGLTNGDT